MSELCERSEYSLCARSCSVVVPSSVPEVGCAGSAATRGGSGGGRKLACGSSRGGAELVELAASGFRFPDSAGDGGWLCTCAAWLGLPGLISSLTSLTVESSCEVRRAPPLTMTGSSTSHSRGANSCCRRSCSSRCRSELLPGELVAFDGEESWDCDLSSVGSAPASEDTCAPGGSLPVALRFT